jgi:hypothetical protein
MLNFIFQENILEQMRYQFLTTRLATFEKWQDQGLVRTWSI